MKFLDARRVVDQFQGGPRLDLRLALSGNAEPFELYCKAEGALAGRSVSVQFLPFGTLQQHLLTPDPGDRTEVILLTPWDFVPEADWRSGIALTGPGDGELEDRIASFGRRLEGRTGAAFCYLEAPLCPAALDPLRNRSLSALIDLEVSRLGATRLPGSAFGLSSYLSTGCPVAGTHLGDVAAAIMARLLTPVRDAKKVLVTDFDNVLWKGVLAEDGPSGVAMRPEGAGYRHFIYQTLLKRFHADGVLIAGVTRNGPEIVQPVFADPAMVLAESDFVAVVASYGAKSAQIRQLAEQLNLGLDSFVFVDDNPLELAEVGAELPLVTVRPFPIRDDGLEPLLAALVEDFRRSGVTQEDRDRTALYRRRLSTMAPSELAGADLTGFLRGLEMKLTIVDRSSGDRTRAVQLINKTNQFNLNGRRVDDADVDRILRAGGRFFGATLEDRSGSHGEVLAYLVDADGVVRSFVMSCRVFQRRVEHAFLAWLAQSGVAPAAFDYAPTERNEPIRMFLDDPAWQPSEAGYRFDVTGFVAAHGPALDLFAVAVEGIPA